MKSKEIMAIVLNLRSLADCLEQAIEKNQVQEEQVVEEKQAEKKEQAVVEEKQPDKKEKQPKALTLEEVRAKLAVKSDSGKRAEVKELIKKYGATKLTELDPANYADLLKEAEAL